MTGENIKRIKRLSKLNVEEDVCMSRKTGVEENIKMNIVKPHDADFEHPVKRKKADIALMIDRKPKVIIEVKSLEKKLDDHKVQALDYARNKGIMWVILTNGKNIQLYKSFIEGVDIDRNKPIFETTLKDLPANFSELYGYVSKAHIKRIETTTREKIEIIKRSITEEDLLRTLNKSKEELFFDIKKQFESRYEKDKDFKNNIDSWLKEQGIGGNNWMDKLCEEGAYSIINRLLFLRICADRGFINQQITDDWISKVESAEFNKTVTTLLKVAFGDIGEKFKGIYEVPLFDGIYFEDIEWNKKTISAVSRRLKEYDFKKIDRDIIGHVYEKHIDSETRKRLGQFYTPNVIIDYILQEVNITPEKKIIDPGCGSGGFLIRAYDIIEKQMRKDNWKINKIHENILKHCLYGIDINPFASQLTVMNLLLKNLEAPVSDVHIVTGNSLMPLSMLPAHVMQKKAVSEVKGEMGEEITLASVLKEKYDCVVGNPPAAQSMLKDIKHPLQWKKKKHF